VTKPLSARPALGVLGVALFAFIVLGMAHESLGVAWPSMRAEFDRPVSDLGLLLAFSSTGYLVASGGYGWAHRRAGTGALLTLGSLLICLGLAGVSFVRGWPLVAVAALSMGLGGGLTDTGLNAHAALSFDLRSINLLHGAYGIGATLGPLVITASLASGLLWRGGYGLVAILQLLVLVAVWVTRRNWAEDQTDDERGFESAAGSMWMMVALFFLYTGVEVAAGQWAFTLLTEGRGMATGPAGIWVATYWGGLTIGRLGFGVIGNDLRASSILNGSIVTALSGLLILWLDPGGLGFAGLPIAGLGLAAIFPTLVSLTPGRIGRERSTSSIGFQLAAASLGAATIPWALGIFAEARGVPALGPGLFVAGVVLAAVYLAGNRHSRVVSS
jgi:fucose permease